MVHLTLRGMVPTIDLRNLLKCLLYSKVYINTQHISFKPFYNYFKKNTLIVCQSQLGIYLNYVRISLMSSNLVMNEDFHNYWVNLIWKHSNINRIYVCPFHKC